MRLLPRGDEVGHPARSDEGAVGSHTHEPWLKIGQMQFDYLVSHGLKPGMRMLRSAAGTCGLAAFHRPPGRGRLLRDQYLPRHLAGRPAHPGRGRPAGQTAAPGRGPDLKLEFLPAGTSTWCTRTACSRTPRRRHRGVPGARRAGDEAGRLLRLHLRPHRGHRASGAARGLLLPDRELGRARRPVRPNRTIHDRLGKTSAYAIEATYYPPGRVTNISIIESTRKAGPGYRLPRTPRRACDDRRHQLESPGRQAAARHPWPGAAPARCCRFRSSTRTAPITLLQQVAGLDRPRAAQPPSTLPPSGFLAARARTAHDQGRRTSTGQTVRRQAR